MNELSEMTEGQFLLLENAQWWHGGTLPGTRTPRTDVARAAAAEIRRLRASLAERDELPARAGEVLDAFSIVEIDRKEHIRAVDGSSYVIFNEGEFFGADIFFAIGRRAASLASEIKEKQP